MMKNKKKQTPENREHWDPKYISLRVEWPFEVYFRTREVDLFIVLSCLACAAGTLDVLLTSRHVVLSSKNTLALRRTLPRWYGGELEGADGREVEEMIARAGEELFGLGWRQTLRSWMPRLNPGETR
ncbi:MAG: hypothetical protein R3C01_17135 [Planctomycetaceae bacterium]